MAEHAIVSIVDDDTSVRVATGRLLKLSGFTVHAFGSAEEFLRSKCLDETQCLVTDIRMPGMSGIELQDELNRRGYHTPIIFITAFPQESDHRLAMASGAVCFLKKPFDAESLIGCVERALNTN
jgi:FixJ family two-component response regulator